MSILIVEVVAPPVNSTVMRSDGSPLQIRHLTMNNDHPEIGEVESDTQAIDYPTKKRQIVLMLLAYSAILGIISCFLPKEDTPLGFP